MPQGESETQIPNVGFLTPVSLLPARIAKKHSEQPQCNLSQNCRYGATGETPTAILTAWSTWYTCFAPGEIFSPVAMHGMRREEPSHDTCVCVTRSVSTYLVKFFLCRIRVKYRYDTGPSLMLRHVSLLAVTWKQEHSTAFPTTVLFYIFKVVSVGYIALLKVSN